MNKRRRYIIDKKFQLKTAFSFIGITTLLMAVILIAISATVIFNNDRIHKIIKIEDNIFQTFTAMSLQQNKSVNDETIGKMSMDHYNNFKATDRIIRYNSILLISLLVFIILQGILLYILIIRKTHRISGPIYVMSNYLRDMINGKMPNLRPLRDKDEFGDFYDLFIQFVASFKKYLKK